MTDYEYDPDLPYVLEHEGGVIARFKHAYKAFKVADFFRVERVIDTTPKPRVPDDAKYITWHDHFEQFWFAVHQGNEWQVAYIGPRDIDNLPGVTSDTVFTVLDERKSDD